MLDTDVLIDLERELPAADAWLDTLSGLPPVAGFAAMELLNGCQNNAERRKVEKFLRPFPTSMAFAGCFAADLCHVHHAAAGTWRWYDGRFDRRYGPGTRTRSGNF